jgi:hypothetical protein
VRNKVHLAEAGLQGFLEKDHLHMPSEKPSCRSRRPIRVRAVFAQLDLQGMTNDPEWQDQALKYLSSWLAFLTNQIIITMASSCRVSGVVWRCSVLSGLVMSTAVIRGAESQS